MVKHLLGKKAYILKIAIFATGISGIVSEYTLATLASNFLGDSTLQWSLTVSVMLFAMGAGSRITRLINGHLLEYFLITEFVLSVLSSQATNFAYATAAYTSITGILIYTFSFSIGLLIGIEIPLVTRINEEYEELKHNLSSVLSLDYFGSLAGGLLFAFVGIPLLGLTYTPVISGGLNMAVAIVLFFTVYPLGIIKKPVKVVLIGSLSCILMLAGLIFTKDIILRAEQHKYSDKVVFSARSKYQHLVITQWKEHFWFFINGNQQFSTLDEYLYHEPLVHPSAGLAKDIKHVLIIGGGDGLAVRELNKYQTVEKIDLVDLDSMVTNLAMHNPIFLSANDSSLHKANVQLFHTDGMRYLEETEDLYDLIIIDLPDPKTIDLSRMYSKEFYLLCKLRLNTNGVIITQAGSPYYATRAFYCVKKTMAAAGFHTAALHNQILTLGEWGWVIGSTKLTETEMIIRLRQLSFNKLSTRWLTGEAMLSITSFGKPLTDTTGLQINTLTNPILDRYYINGKWDLY